MPLFDVQVPFPDTRDLMRGIQAHPPDPIAEIEDFMAFIAAREQDLALTHASAAARALAVAAIWDNPEDDAYEFKFGGLSMEIEP